jgi:hypothetical protein
VTGFDPTVVEFKRLLNRRAWNAFGGQITVGHLHQALERGWTLRQVAAICNTDQPRDGSLYAALQSRIHNCSQTDPPGATRPAGPGLRAGGCEHTDDPAGWVMDDDGRVTGKCPCWGSGAA